MPYWFPPINWRYPTGVTVHWVFCQNIILFLLHDTITCWEKTQTLEPHVLVCMCACIRVCVCVLTKSCDTPYIPANFHTSIFGLNKWLQSTVTLPLRHSIYLFICLHSFILFLAGAGEGNYWCGTAGEEANLSVGTSEVWGRPQEAPAPHLFHLGLEEKWGHWGKPQYGIRHSIWTHTHTLYLPISPSPNQ